MSEVLRARFEGDPDMAFAAKVKGEIIWANPSAIAGLSYSLEQL